MIIGNIRKIKRVVTNILTGSNFIVFNDLGARLITILRSILLTRPGFLVSLSPVRVVTLEKVGVVISTVNSGVGSVLQKCGLRLSTINTGVISRPLVSEGNRILSFISGVVAEIQKPSFLLSTVNTGETFTLQKPAFNFQGHNTGSNDKPLDKPAFNLLQIKYDLTHVSGSNVVTQSPVAGRSDWLTITNAQGKVNTTVATIAGNALGARGGQLDLAYADFLNKASLLVSSVKLKFYVAQATVVGESGDFRLKYEHGGKALTTLQTITGNISNLTTPIEFNITADWTSTELGDGTVWTELNGLITHVSFESAALEVQTASCDAVELEIIASRTDSI